MMRKIKTLYSRTLLLRAMACGLILTVLLNLAGFSAQCAALEENIVRLHVIANSNDEADQAVKLRVRDAVLREAEQWYGDAEDFDTAVTALCTHLESLEAAANSVLKAENFPYCAKAEICEMYVPTRTYESFKLPAGRYRTLRISLGKAEGKNWWCVMYPNMCFRDNTYEVVGEDEKEQMYQVFTLYQYKKLIESEDKQIRFRYL